MSELRGSLQKLFTDFTRGVEERIEVACAPDGPVTTAILHDMERALSLTETPQARSILVRIAPESERRTLDAIASRFREHARSDVTAANDLLRMSASEAAAVFDARGLAAPVPEFKPFDGVALEQLLARQVAFQRQYIGTLPKTGPFEYVMIARRYQMMLFMFISAFGLSFLRTYREFMVPSAVLLLSLGAVNVWLSVRREHVEDRLRERDKARELLRTDIRRLLSELERGWTNAVNGALTAALADYAAQLNAVVADAETHRLGRLQDVRHAQQRQIQGAESVERRLVALQKAATMAEASVAQACGEIRQLLRSAIAGGPA
jgi:hypothetical protein